MVTRPTPSTSAISFCVICSTKYIQAARMRSRSDLLSLTDCSASPAWPFSVLLRRLFTIPSLVSVRRRRIRLFGLLSY